MLAKLPPAVGTYSGYGGYEQISRGGNVGGLGDGTSSAAGVFACLQSQKVYAAPVVRLFGVEELSQDRINLRGRGSLFC